jgi:hypothetical protein
MLPRFLTSKKIATPLTDLCSRVNLQVILDTVETDDPADPMKRAKVLSFLMMMGAAEIVRSLKWEKSKTWKGSSHFFRETNMDVITAEALIWISYLTAQLWKAERDHEMLSRVGSLTFTHANELTLSIIEEATGVDFKDRAVESRKLYIATQVEGRDEVGAFAGRVIASVGCKSLADPLRLPSLPRLEDTVLCLGIYVFYASRRMTFYNMFTMLLRERSEPFPHDEDV